MPHPFSGRLPSLCAVCHAWPAQPLCEACVARFAQPLPRCSTCALPLPQDLKQCGECLTTPPPLDACLAAVSYTFPWPALVADFKFNASPSWAGPFAQLVRSMPYMDAALDSADWVLPMPLSTERLRERGYNQAWELARRLAPRSAQAEPRLLLRILDSPPQSGLKRAERLRNLRTTFATDPLRAGLLKRMRVVLVDDVMTSGASLHAAALALRAAGAAHITGLVFARTDPDH